MKMTLQITFQQFLALAKTLIPAQKAELKKELDEPITHAEQEQDDFINFLLNGPVYSDEDIAVIEENRKSIAAWRTRR